MTGFSFKLEPMHEGPRVGFKGIAGSFGDVSVHYAPRHAARDPRAETLLEGTAFPEVVFTGGGRSGKPSLDGGWLKIDGVAVKTNFRVTGVRKGSRRLEMFYLDRKYVYTTTGEAKTSTLRRGEVVITISPSRDITKNVPTRATEVSGPGDPIDLAVAIIFEGVDTSILTLGGALSNIAFNFFNSQNDGGGA